MSFFAKCALLAASIAPATVAGYSLTDDYTTSNFFSMMSFFTEADPTHGYVQYVDEGTAQSEGLIQSSSDSVYIGVDANGTASGSGRQSVRLTSSKTYNQGLFVIDVEHMPTGCGTWPAFWLVGPNWPNEGEIDIIEGVNNQAQNKMTLHTGAGCTISNSYGMSGTVDSTNCDVSDGDNEGCGITASSSQSYGAGLNSAGGGVYATEWTASTISIWFWPSGSAPSDVSGSNPNPAGWGTPAAMFGGCDTSSHFKDMNIVFDTTFCGDWAGDAFSSDSTCSSKASSCEDYVANNPSAFTDAYWKVRSLKVYGGSSTGSTTPGATPSPTPYAGGSGGGSSVAAGFGSSASGASGSAPTGGSGGGSSPYQSAGSGSGSNSASQAQYQPSSSQPAYGENTAPAQNGQPLSPSYFTPANQEQHPHRHHGGQNGGGGGNTYKERRHEHGAQHVGRNAALKMRRGRGAHA